jgi:hypothetical protein
MRRPRLLPKQRYLITKWIDENGMAGTRSETARIASESLGFEVTADHVSSSADDLGLSLKTDRKATEIIAKDLVDLRLELGLKVSDELSRIAHKQAP